MARAVLRPNRNVWQVARASRAAILVDGAAYFRAVRESMARAKRSIFIVGWDIDSRTRLVGESGRADDGLPETLAEFLSELVTRKPDLVVHLLLWDFSMLYALEREVFPALALNWNTPDQVRFCLDNQAPLGCSQHQKIVVVDDSVAFSGGLDLTIRRWDTPSHDFDNPLRVDPAGTAYSPFHDVQAVVQGAPAHALASLVRRRWRQADCSEPVRGDVASDCWPPSVTPDFANVDVGIARTEPACAGKPSIREVERLFVDTIASAERAIYMENQFLTSEKIARAIALRMQSTRALEVVIVAPETPESWIETHTMRNGRIRFRQILEEAGVWQRVRLVAPLVVRAGESVSTMVHSKVTIIDDRLLRIGSANLNNRSMGADSECDLIFDAGTAAHRDAILRIRNALLGEHCGATSAEVGAAIAESGSILAVVDSLHKDGHRLQPIDDGAPDPEEFAAYMESLADPERPWRRRPLFTWVGQGLRVVTSLPAAKFTLIGLLLLALTLSWYYSPLADYARPSSVQAALADVRSSYWAPAVAIGAFLLGGAIAFPLTILILATTATFGPWLGLLYATVGAMLSAIAMYAAGAWLGRDSLRNFLGERLNQIRKRVVRQGVVAIAAIRLVPVAPFTIVNLVAGASGIGLREYTAGTLLGLAPGLMAMAFFGPLIMRTFSSPSLSQIVLLLGAVIAWIALAFAVQAVVARGGSETA